MSGVSALSVGCLNLRVLRLPSPLGDFTQRVWGRARFCVPTSSQVTQTPLVWGHTLRPTAPDTVLVQGLGKRWDWGPRTEFLHSIESSEVLCWLFLSDSTSCDLSLGLWPFIELLHFIMWQSEQQGLPSPGHLLGDGTRMALLGCKGTGCRNEGQQLGS